MKFILKIILLFSTLLIFENNSIALTDYQIKVICQKKRKRRTCIKNLEIKRSKLLKGKRIEIPVINFKK